LIEEVVSLTDVEQERWGQNAHTRKTKVGKADIVVRAKPKLSGRFERCIPIGEWRARAYRVRADVLDAWGGLSVKDGYIQRSIVPPAFIDALRFYDWFLKLNIPLIQKNN
jgi:hypothetical protein